MYTWRIRKSQKIMQCSGATTFRPEGLSRQCFLGPGDNWKLCRRSYQRGAETYGEMQPALSNHDSGGGDGGEDGKWVVQLPSLPSFLPPLSPGPSIGQTQLEAIWLESPLRSQEVSCGAECRRMGSGSGGLLNISIVLSKLLFSFSFFPSQEHGQEGIFLLKV